MNIVQNSQQKNTNSKQPFFLMTAEQAKQDYKAKLITAETYIYYIIKAHRSAGWKWSFSVKEFCQEWEIKERTFYHAVSKLKSKKLIEWQTEGRITVWWGSDIAINDSSNCNNSSNLDTVSPLQTFAEPVQSIAVEEQTFAVTMQSVAVEEQPFAPSLQTFAVENAETLTGQAIQSPIDIKQIETISTDIVSICETEQELPQNDASSGEASSAEPVQEENKKLSDEELIVHLQTAQETRVIPTKEIQEQLIDSNFCNNYYAVARVNNWPIEPKKVTRSLETEQRLEAFKTKHMKPWLRNCQ